MKERIEHIIKEYLSKEYGREDVIPGLMLSGIADEIDKHRWEFHAIVQEEYDMEDIDSIAEENEYKLTMEEKKRILHRFKKIEDSNLDQLSYIIDEVVQEREDK